MRTPQHLGQVIAGENLARAEQQSREYHALPAGGDIDGFAVVGNRQRT